MRGEKETCTVVWVLRWWRCGVGGSELWCWWIGAVVLVEVVDLDGVAAVEMEMEMICCCCCVFFFFFLFNFDLNNVDNRSTLLKKLIPGDNPRRHVAGETFHYVVLWKWRVNENFGGRVSQATCRRGNLKIKNLFKIKKT